MTSNDQYDREEAREIIQALYGGGGRVEVDPNTLGQLPTLHDGVTAFLAMFDQGTGDDFELPDDLDGETKRQLSTAHTLLVRATSGIEDTARERLNDATENDS